MKKYLISACLLGLNTRYDGESNPETVFLEMVKTGEAIPFCPEQAGGLPTPRDPSEIIGGDGRDVLKGKARVITDKGQDVTEKFLKGAKETCKLAKLLGVDKAILKSKALHAAANVFTMGPLAEVCVRGWELRRHIYVNMV